MNKIGIITNANKDKDFKITKLLSEKLKNRGLDVVNEFSKDSDMIISLGGDGTFLRAALKAYKYNIPILGVNMGNLGFLAEVNKDDLDFVVDSIVNDQYSIEERLVLKAELSGVDGECEEYIALNEVVVSRSAISRVLNIKIYLDDVLIDKFPADGIIVSTPTGSTAYSLSAGGPIMEPSMDAMIICPICPHILHSRSIVLSPNKTIGIEIENKEANDAVITFDGQKTLKFKETNRVNITKLACSVKFVKLLKRNFFEIVRDKLFDRG